MKSKKKSKSAVFINVVISKLQIICGIILTILFGITLIVGAFDTVDDDISMLVTIFILTFLSVFLLTRGIQRGKLVKLFKSYALRLSEDNSYSLMQLADSIGTNVDIVKKNIELMITRGFFVNAYIDTVNNTIVFPDRGKIEEQSYSNNNVRSSGAEQRGEQNAVLIITCKGCGATNRIRKGSSAECEFCGSALN